MTHHGSGWEPLRERLLSDRRFDCFETGFTYQHPDDVGRLTSWPHRRENSAAVWVDFLFHDHQFSMRRLAKHYNFLYWASDRAACVGAMRGRGLTDWNAERYYGFRLATMRQYHVRAGGPWNPNLQDDAFFAAVLG